uniref:Uncharacterized protein n=1 Tax=Siphoviridae sp. ctM6i4 TaxID=2827852 RepID=A0A8S5T2M1_9CAUD|nr:MAG TPA: hypothetical protein [Siphoviridae sp. ctM6i4]
MHVCAIPVQISSVLFHCKSVRCHSIAYLSMSRRFLCSTIQIMS